MNEEDLQHWKENIQIDTELFKMSNAKLNVFFLPHGQNWMAKCQVIKR